MPKPKHAWMVRAGNPNLARNVTNELADLVEGRGAVAIGWWELGDLSNLTTKNSLEQQYIQVSGKRDGNAIGQINLFRNEIGIGDYVLTYIRSDREYAVGIAISGYEYDPQVFSDEHLLQPYPQIQKVDWIKKRIPRDILSDSAKKVLGNRKTVFSCDRVLDEIHKSITEPVPRPLLPPLPRPFRGLIYEPANEQGVVFLFGMIFRELGFIIETIRVPYPDCEARRFNYK